MEKKTEEKKPEIEREYIIPLREKCRAVPRYKKTNKAVKTVKEFLVRHMKVYDKDLNKIKLDRYLNEFLWARGIKNPPHKVKVKAIKEGEFVNVSLVDFPNKLSKKKAREEKLQKKALEDLSEKKSVAKEDKKVSKEDVKKEEEEKEKKASVLEAGKEIAKEAAKQAKHEIKGAHKEKATPRRQALKK
jgi:large subunit ribosomal protein L31e